MFGALLGIAFCIAGTLFLANVLTPQGSRITRCRIAYAFRNRRKERELLYHEDYRHPYTGCPQAWRPSKEELDELKELETWLSN